MDIHAAQKAEKQVDQRPTGVALLWDESGVPAFQSLEGMQQPSGVQVFRALWTTIGSFLEGVVDVESGAGAPGDRQGIEKDPEAG